MEFGSLQSARILQKAMRESKVNGNHEAAFQSAYQKVKNLSIIVHILSAENHFLNFGYFTYPSYFHFACMRNDPKTVLKFIENGADVNTPISRNAEFCGLYSPLHFAVESNCIENVKLLLEHGAIVENQNNKDMTPLHLAMYYDIYNKERYTIVDYLYAALENKEKNIEDDYGLSYLHIACTRNDVELVKKLLDSGQNVNETIQRNPHKFSNYTPLHFAVYYQCYETVQLLIKRGANVNSIDYDESGSPLHLACEVGHADIIDSLLKNGAKAHLIRTKGHKTTLHLLVESYMDRQNGLSNESRMNLLAFVKKLVKLGVNVNARDQFDYTALHIACWKLVDGSQCVKKLLEVGANINFVNMDGQTPLEMTYFESYCGNAEDYMTLYHHVQKLKVLGYKVNPKNEAFCDVVLREKDIWDPEHKDFKNKKIAKKEEQRLDEIHKLRNVRLYHYKFTLYDLLVADGKNITIFAHDSVVKKIMAKKGLKKEYPVFAHFLRYKYDKAVKRLQNWNSKRSVNRINTMRGRVYHRFVKSC
ncbi:serine/threonine-protein phosphatase 6 regulatory ankyrin repeat subunit A-like isoform X2 [Phymastichus coffea]|nr:serine/threonine-protein phosphatase 6 regulatory ankyrin repeat subunit A-like isoform X2 [Phymastichus coffea]